MLTPFIVSILDKQLTVKLNANWQAFQVVTVGKAVTFLCSEANGEKPGFAMDYETAIDENGEMVLIYANPVSWDEWVKLPVRECDLGIGIGPDPVTNEPRQIRVPLVVICSRYKKVPPRTVRWSPTAVRLRDKGICQVSKRKLALGEGNTGHIIARHRGGKDTFENTIYMDKRLNTLQGIKTPQEMGWHIVPPKAPAVTPSLLKAEDAVHPSQKPFLM